MATPWKELRRKHLRWWMLRKRFRVWRYKHEITKSLERPVSVESLLTGDDIAVMLDEEA